MRTVLIAVALMLAGPATASPEDDFTACVIGKAAVALAHQTGERDPLAAAKTAYAQCPTDSIDYDQLDGIGNEVAQAVIAISNGVYGTNVQFPDESW